MSNDEEHDEHLWMYRSFPDSYPDADPDADPDAGSDADSDAGSYAGSYAGSFAGSETSKAASLVESVSSFLSSSSTVPSLVISSWHSAADKIVARTCGGPEKKDARCQSGDRSSWFCLLYTSDAADEV